MLNEGTRNRDALQISARSEALGAASAPAPRWTHPFITLSAITSRLPESLELFSDVLLNPTFPDKELARLKRNRSRRSNAEVTATRYRLTIVPASDLWRRDTSYSKPFSGIGTEATVSSMTTG